MTFAAAFALLMMNECSFPPDVLAKIGPNDSRYKLVYSEDPYDAGGNTKYGIAQASHPDVNVKEMTLDQAQAIYEKDYWQQFQCDQMPWAIGWTFFDCVVNHGPETATRFLQTAVGTVVDGQLGAKTLAAAINAKNPVSVARDITLARRDYVENLHNYDRFRAGWNRRQLDTLIGAAQCPES